MSDYKLWSFSYLNLLPKQHEHDSGPRKPKECSKEVFQKVIKHQKQLAKDDRSYNWGLYLKKTGQFVGMIDIYVSGRGGLACANLGYVIFNNFWRSGYANEALNKIIKAALVDLKLNRLEAVVDINNKASIKLAKKLNLRHEGIRKGYWFHEGNWTDQRVFVADRKLLKLPKLRPS